MFEREPNAIPADDRIVVAHRLRRNWALHLGTLALGIAVFVGTQVDPWYAPFGWFGGVVFAFVTFLFVTRNAFPRATPASVRATKAQLVIDGWAIPAEDIAEAKLTRQPRAGGDQVLELVLRDRATVSLSLLHADALDVLRVLGIGAGERRATFTTVVPYWRRLLVSFGVFGLPWVVMMLVASHDEGMPIGTVNVVLIFSAIVAGLAGYIRGKVVIGSEGFATRWLFLRRFVSFSEVQAIRTATTRNRDAAHTIVELRAGRRVVLRSLETPESDAQRGAESEALLRHLSQAHDRWRHTRSASVTAPLLQRGGRTARDWVASLEHVVRGGGSGYRVATVNLETLVEIVRTPPEDRPDARVGAAAALVRVGVDEHRVAIRVAAEACAEAKTRAVLLDLSSARTDREIETILDRASR